MLMATALGSISALYDKYLIQRVLLDASTVHARFSIYLVVVIAPLCLHWFLKERHIVQFHWRWAFPLVAILLLISDYT